MRGIRYRPNESGEAMARRVRETFTDTDCTKVADLDWDWPSQLMDVGDCLAVMYRSDKWDPGVYTDYKHVSEAPQRLLAAPGFLQPYRRGPGSLSGPMVRLPKFRGQFAELADCLNIQARIFGDDGEERYIQIDLSGMYLGGLQHRRKYYLCVYDLNGCHLMVDGERLDIQKDGITG